MKKLLLPILIAISSTVYGQQKMITYYDDYKRHKLEEYTTDAQQRPHGSYIMYGEDGKIIQKSTYVHGELHGKSTTFAATGGISGSYNYKMGEKEGLQQDYMWGYILSKQPIAEEFYKNGHLVWARRYDITDDGRGKRYLKSEEKYKNGIQVWERGYNPDGTTKYAGNFVLNESGSYYASDENGNFYLLDSMQGGAPYVPPRY